MTKTNLLPDEIEVYHDKFGDLLAFKDFDLRVPGTRYVRADLVSAPNKPAEVDLGAGWINPHDKTQKQWLPWIGERVLFQTKSGDVFEGKHGGGSWVKLRGNQYIENSEVVAWVYPKHLATGKGGGEPAAPTQIDAGDKWEPLKISNGYQYPAQSGEYIVRMIDGAELRSQYDGRFFRRKDNCDKIIPAHEIVCFKAIRAAPTQIDAGGLERAIADLQSRLNISSEITINEGMPMKVNGLSQLSAERLLQAARANLEKSKGGV